MSSKLSPLFVLPLMAVAAPLAQAADMVEPVMPPAEVSPINYMSLEGGPVWNNSGFDESSDKYGDIDDEDGFYVSATYRRLFRPDWDWQASLAGTWVDTSSSGEEGRFESDLDFQTFDFDFGYHPGANPLNRFLFGVRVLHMNDEMTLTDEGFEYGSYDSEGWAAGPRLGFQTETMLGGSQFGFVAEGSGSILFGSFDRDYFDFEGDPSSSSSDDSRTIYNLEALAGISWHATSQFTLTAGYRAQKWWNLRDGATVSDSRIGVDYSADADEDPLFHGPFLRAATTF
jgi:opacity protein-like surface antigen